MRIWNVSKFEMKAYAILGTILYLMLGACAKDEPFRKSVDLPKMEEPAGPTATFDPRSISPTTPAIVRVTTRTNARPAAS